MTTFDEFAVRARADGFVEPRAVEYAPNADPEMHAHDFDARVLITDGELHMALDDTVLVLGPGQECNVPAGTLHSERTEAMGAVGFLATRAR